MIDVAIHSVGEELNEFLRTKFSLNEDRVIVSNLVNPDGSRAVKDENKVIITLAGIEHEKLATPKSGNIVSPGGSQPVYLNLFLLFSAAFNERLNMEALKFVSAIIAFFQSKKVFTPQNCPGLPNSVEKLVFDIYNLDFREQSNLWSYLGAKYMPSIFYRVRMVMIDEGLITNEIPTVGGLDPEIGGK